MRVRQGTGHSKAARDPGGLGIGLEAEGLSADPGSLAVLWPVYVPTEPVDRLGQTDPAESEADGRKGWGGNSRALPHAWYHEGT